MKTIHHRHPNGTGRNPIRKEGSLREGRKDVQNLGKKLQNEVKIKKRRRGRAEGRKRREDAWKKGGGRHRPTDQ